MISENQAAVGIFFAIVAGLASVKLVALPWLLRRRRYRHRPVLPRDYGK